MPKLNRIQFDIQGSIYTLPINPRNFEPLVGMEYSLSDTVDGRPVPSVPEFDGRVRKMTWQNLPGREPYKTMISTLRSAVGISGVKMRIRDLDLSSNGGLIWKDITIENVEYRYLSANNKSQSSDMSYNVDLTFAYNKSLMDSTKYAFFMYQPGNYANSNWITSISGVMDFHTIITNPSLGSVDTSMLRYTFPNANILMYYNQQDHHMHTYGGNYFNALQEATIGVSGYLFTFVSGPYSGDQIHNFGGANPDQYEGTMHTDLAEAVINVISGNVMGDYEGFEYDGVYVDMLTPEYPIWKARYYNNFVGSGYAIDIDNDGSGESEAEMQARYEEGRNHFISGLRLALPDKIIIGNSAGDSSNEELNGFTIENITYTNSAGDSDVWFRDQDNISKQANNYHIAWAIHPTASGGDLLEFCNARENVIYGYHEDYWGI